MRTPKTTISRVTILATLLACAIGCSVFEPFHTPGSSDDVDVLLSDSYEALDKGHYDKAMTIMDKAMGIAPNDPRVRYLHAVTAVKARDIDMYDVVAFVQPADGGFSVDSTSERVLFMSDAELENLYEAFRIVSADLKPLVEGLTQSGREYKELRETDDVFMSYGVAETIVGMLRVIDNDDTASEFSPDRRLIITKTPVSFDIGIEDIFLPPAELDQIVDTAIERSWDHFVQGRRALFLYYQFVVNEVIWTQPVSDPPERLPEQLDTGNTVGAMVDFVDDLVRMLYEEKEDL
jgi:hypothetical protein